MPDFDLDAALSSTPILWSGKMQVNPANREQITGCWLLYCLDPASNTTKVAHDFKVSVASWKQRGVTATEMRYKLRRLLDYLNRLSAENPDKPYHPNYQHQSIWTWVYDVAGHLDDPAIADL